MFRESVQLRTATFIMQFWLWGTGIVRLNLKFDWPNLIIYNKEAKPKDLST